MYRYECHECDVDFEDLTPTDICLYCGASDPVLVAVED